MDRLTSLEVFSRVVETGGFSAAARKLNMSTTMVSNHVQALEDRLGVRLLQRTTRKVNLTEIGRAYYDRCIQILADIEQADDIASELQSVPRGHATDPRRHAHGAVRRARGGEAPVDLSRAQD
ncbi:DNA-binding transcriptional LysR family regulator [Bradyrhizobium sp. LM2.9]